MYSYNYNDAFIGASCFRVNQSLDQKKHFFFKYALFLIAGAFYVLMMATLHIDVAKGAAHHVSPEIQRMFEDVEILTIVSWSLYPPTVLLGRAHFGVVSDALEDSLICVLDCVSKIAFEGLIIYHVIKIYGDGSSQGDDDNGGGHRYF